MKKILYSRFLLCIVLFSATYTICCYSVQNREQLGSLKGLSEEYFRLGTYHYKTGNLYFDESVPFVFRPPGYIYFISVLHSFKATWTDVLTRILGINVPRSGYIFLYYAQGLLLALSTILLFLWLSYGVRRDIAFMLSLLFGCNPYTVILVGLAHYEILHIFLTLAACLILHLGLKTKRVRSIVIAASGILFGLTTLTRPMTLIFPAFALILFYLFYRKSRGVFLRSFAVFTISMVVTILPYTVRNYSITGRIIPVNAQMGSSVWASTEMKLPVDANRFRWWTVWRKHGLKIYKQATNNKHYKYEEYVKNIVKIEDAFKKRAAQNILDKPEVYAYNVAHTFKTFNVDINSVFIKYFQARQIPDKKVTKYVFDISDAQDFHHSDDADTFEVFIAILTVFSMLALMIAIKKRDLFMLVPGAVYLCFLAAHTVTYMDLMYYYIKVPFLFFFSAYFISAVGRLTIKVPRHSWSVSPAYLLILPLVGIELYMLSRVIIFPA